MIEAKRQSLARINDRSLGFRLLGQESAFFRACSARARRVRAQSAGQASRSECEKQQEPEPVRVGFRH
jgi:hypothetical protein